MTRFSKGTTDHDGDGRMGGSRKGDATMAKKPRKAAMTRAEDTAEAKRTIPAKREAAAEQFAEADAVAAEGADVKLRMAALGGL